MLKNAIVHFQVLVSNLEFAPFFFKQSANCSVPGIHFIDHNSFCDIICFIPALPVCNLCSLVMTVNVLFHIKIHDQ